MCVCVCVCVIDHLAGQTCGPANQLLSQSLNVLLPTAGSDRSTVRLLSSRPRWLTELRLVTGNWRDIKKYYNFPYEGAFT